MNTTKHLKNEDVNKYETKNPIVRLVHNNFFGCQRRLMNGIDFETVFEAGCGGGYVTEFIKQQFPTAEIYAMDINEEKLSLAKARIKDVQFSVGTIYDINHQDNAFDLVISNQVIEHLDDPLSALEELMRIAKRYVIISVPNEPLYRITNVMRFKHLSALGNTPGHINHWSKAEICTLASKICDVREIRTPFPFIMLLCEKRCGINPSMN